MLYGCNVAADLAGAEFLQDLSQYTAADILASTDLTGSDKLAGDWDLEYAVGDIEAELAFNAEIQNSYQNTLVGGSFTSNLSTNLTFNNYLDVNFPEITGSDLNFNLETDFNLPNPSELSFEPSQINFNNLDFNYDSVSINNDKISFGFTSGEFDFAPIPDSQRLMEFKFDDYTFDFESMFSFQSDSITFEDNQIEFEYDPGSFQFTGAELFQANNNLFDYKFLDGDITLIDGEIPFTEYNASDFRALEYAFTGDEIFDSEYYLATNLIPDGMNPFTDYIENGYQAGRDPNSLFDVDYYLDQNPDVRIAGLDPLTHYAVFGYGEDNLNRDPNALFDSSYYNQNNPDVVDAEIPSLLHYILFGNSESLNNRDPNAIFDNSYYNQLNPDVAESGMTALEHYVQFGWQESRPESPNFNPNRNPNPFFSTSDYFILNDDVRIASYEIPSANPVQHMLEFGIAEGRITHQIFDSENIFKFTRVITPDSNDFPQVKQQLKNNGLEIISTDDGKILISDSLLDPIIDPIIDKAVKLTATFLTAVVLEPLVNPIFDAIDTAIDAGSDFASSIDWQVIVDNGFNGFSDPSTIGFLRVIPEGTPSSDVASITYGDPSLEDLLTGTPPFPGQTESERLLEIFLPPTVDGVEDYTIFPEEGIFLPTNTVFPKGDEILEDIINGGLFLGGEETPQGVYVLAIDNQGPTRGLQPNGTFDDLETEYETTIAEQLLAEGNRLISIGDKNVKKTLAIPVNAPGIKAPDFLSITPSLRFNLTEVKGASPDSVGADIETAIIQLTTARERLIELVPNAKLGKVEVAVPEGAGIRAPYQVQGNQIVEVTQEGTRVVKIGDSVLTIRR